MRGYFRFTARRWFLLLFAAITPSALWCESKFAAPFEHFRDTGDREVFAREMMQIGSIKMDPGEDLPYLVGLCANGDPILKEQARSTIFTLFYPVPYDLPEVVGMRELLRPLTAIFEGNAENAADAKERAALNENVGA